MDEADTFLCRNCEAVVTRAFCATCGQRDLPPAPTVRELVRDAWHELTGYDGRLLATLRALPLPGRLTREYLAGRRGRYLSPIEVYLSASLLYFLVAAAIGHRPHTAIRSRRPTLRAQSGDIVDTLVATHG